MDTQTGTPMFYLTDVRTFYALDLKNGDTLCLHTDDVADLAHIEDGAALAQALAAEIERITGARSVEPETIETIRVMRGRCVRVEGGAWSVLTEGDAAALVGMMEYVTHLTLIGHGDLHV